jgi:DNA repair exonuclease SbcCD ATPase subunit
LEQLDEHRADLEKAQTNLRALSNELSLVEILKKAFSTNGLVAYKLENLVKDLEQLTNVYLAELSDGRFTLLFSIVSDKLNVKLTDSGNDIDVTALSSGELARVNTATLLAIRKLMNSISKTQINILFLDEVINVLDEYGRDRLVEVLLQEDGLNTFLVSHSWSHPLLGKIHIQKVDGISSIKK